MECIVYFNVVHQENEAKELHGLVIIDEGQAPTEQDYLNMFEDMGYHVRLQDREQLVFVPVDAGAKYKEIRIKRLDTGKDGPGSQDNDLKSVVANLLPSKPTSI